MRGVIARGAGRTLENFCNSEKCNLFHTKTSAIPPQFLALVDVAARMRERFLAANVLDLDSPQWWETEAYLAQERARRIIENEDGEENQSSIDDDMKGDSGAFNFEM